MIKLFFRRAAVSVSAALCLSAAVLNAQEIELPSVTTTITGGTQEIDENALPDFSQILPETEDVLPRLPDTRFSPGENTLDLGNRAKDENEMYLSGFFGGGYPGLFTGDFSIFKTSSKNPFNFHFLHTAHNGYGINSASGGFYDSTTRLDGEALFNLTNTFSLKTGGLYDSNTTGLQNLSPLYSSLSSQTIKPSLSAIWNFSNILGFNADIDGFVSSQYGALKVPVNSQPAVPSNPSFITFLINPSLSMSVNAALVKFTLDGDYNFSGSAESGEYGHRGSVYAILSRSGDFLDAGIKAGGVFLAESKLVPFSLFFKLRGKTSLSEKELSVSMTGGLSSEQTSLYAMHDTHYYSLYNTIPQEQSDWFGSIAFFLPIADILTANMNLGFKSTAFNNGVMVPDYIQTNTQTGLFNFIQINRNELVSDISATYSAHLLSIALGWKASWLDADVLDQRQLIYLNAFISSKDSKFRSSAEIEFEPMRDLIPDISTGVYYSITPSFSLAFEVEDMIKLITGTDRIAAFPYVSSSGSAVITAKFYF